MSKSRIIGGNPLRNLARRQGKVPEAAPVHRVYSEADRRQLLAPIQIRSYGGKSWGGTATRDNDLKSRVQKHERYGWAADWSDLDSAV